MNEIVLSKQIAPMEISDYPSISQSSENMETENFSKQKGFSLDAVWDSSYVVDSFPSDIEFFQVPDNSIQIDRKLQQFVDFGSLDGFFQDLVSPPCQSFDDETIELDTPELIESKKKRPLVLPSMSLEVLHKFETRLRRLKGNQVNVTSPRCRRNSNRNNGQKMSTETIIRLAAKEFIQSSSQSSYQVSTLSHPYASAILGQAEEDLKEVDLVRNLLSCAERVGAKQYESARRLLIKCEKQSLSTGNPVERLAFYFIEELYERIDRETGKFTGKTIADPPEALKSSKTTQIAFHKLLPLSQITKFAGTQAMLKQVSQSRKVHIIDLEIRNGIHCTILMQALATRVGNPLEHLKITAVGAHSRQNSEETGRHLTSFAQSLNLKFSFNVVVVPDIKDLEAKLFDLDEDETIAVYVDYVLTNWIARPDSLNKLMELIRALNPRVMIVSEVEANCNSPIFVDRFVDSLFYYGAFFDALADCLNDDEENRRAAESTCFGLAIKNIVATEGDERKIRHVSIDVWRAYFACFGLVETELSTSSLYQANLVLKNFAHGDSCTFDMNEKSLIIGWKGTPLSSLSVWKFQMRC